MNQFTLEQTEVLSKTSQLEENGDIRIVSEWNLSKTGAVTLAGRCGNLAHGLMFPVAGQTLWSPAFPSLSDGGPRRNSGGTCDRLRIGPRGIIKMLAGGSGRCAWTNA